MAKKKHSIKKKVEAKSYQDVLNEKDYGHPFDNDHGDEVALTDEQEFELLRDSGMKPAEFSDEKEGRRFALWLKKQAPKRSN